MKRLEKMDLKKFLQGVKITGVRVESEESSEIVLKLEKNGMVKELKIVGGGFCGDDVLNFDLLGKEDSVFNQNKIQG